MFKTAYNRFGWLILAAALLVFAGCGGSESGIEGEEEVIAVELSAHDDGDSESEGTFTIDVRRSLCGTPDEEPEEPAEETPAEEASASIEELTPEPYFDTLGKGTFHYIFYCPTCPPGADETYIIDSYTVEYIPLKSPESGGGFFFPPQLVSLDNRPIINQMVLSREFTTAERSFIMISVNTKTEFQEKSIIQDTPRTGAFYSIRVTFHGRNRVGGSFSTTSDLQVTFGNYNNCDE